MKLPASIARVVSVFMLVCDRAFMLVMCGFGINKWAGGQSSSGMWAPKMPVYMPLWLRLQFFVIDIASTIRHEEVWWEWRERLCQELEVHLRDKLHWKPREPDPVMEFTPDNYPNPERVRKEFMSKGIPFVIRGFSKNAAAIKKWTLAELVKKKGEMMTDFHAGDSYEVLNLPFKSILKRKDLYISNNTSVMDDEIAKDLGIDQLPQIVGKGTIVAQALMFFGNTKRTGAAYHSAQTCNLFTQIQGVKRWTIVHPHYNELMYPKWTVPEFAGSRVGYADAPALECPLYKYAPKLMVELQPGDVLFAPSWCMHSILNIQVPNIAVATRHIAVPVLTKNAWFSTSVLQDLALRLDWGLMKRNYEAFVEGLQTGQFTDLVVDDHSQKAKEHEVKKDLGQSWKLSDDTGKGKYDQIFSQIAKGAKVPTICPTQSPQTYFPRG